MTISIDLPQEKNPKEKVEPHMIKVKCISPFLGSFDPDKRDYLREESAEASIHKLLLHVRKDANDYWVGAVVPEGATYFDRVQVFFHPRPTNGGAYDQDYPRLTSQGWRAKYDHMWFLGAQLAKVRKTPLIYPFMRESAFDKQRDGSLSRTSMFYVQPRETLSAIVSAVRAAVTGEAGAVNVWAIGVSGFSSGVEVMKPFAATFGSSIVETNDFDGPFIIGQPHTVWTMPPAVSRVITQVPPNIPNTPRYFYLPAWQFKNIGKTSYAENVHKQIGYLTFLAAMTESIIV